VFGLAKLLLSCCVRLSPVLSQSASRWPNLCHCPAGSAQIDWWHFNACGGSFTQNMCPNGSRKSKCLGL